MINLRLKGYVLGLKNRFNQKRRALRRNFSSRDIYIITGAIVKQLSIVKWLVRFLLERWNDLVLLKTNMRVKKFESNMKFREFDNYKVDVIVEPAHIIYIPAVLPSEPPEGFYYHCSPTGFIGDIHSDTVVLKSPWRNLDNYGHWFLSEFPYIHMMFESHFHNIVFPTKFSNLKYQYQRDTIKYIKEMYLGKEVIYGKTHIKGALPRNHDTSTSEKQINNTLYKEYHHSRATPYCLKAMGFFRNYLKSDNIFPKRIYIVRKSDGKRGVLENEEEVQNYLSTNGFALIFLDNYSVQEPIDFFYNAEIVIGLFGAGLVNLGFCKDGFTKVIEIANPIHLYPIHRATRNYYHMIAHMKKLSYSFIEAPNNKLDIKKLAMETKD